MIRFAKGPSQALCRGPLFLELYLRGTLIGTLMVRPMISFCSFISSFCMASWMASGTPRVVPIEWPWKKIFWMPSWKPPAGSPCKTSVTIHSSENRLAIVWQILCKNFPITLLDYTAIWPSVNVFWRLFLCPSKHYRTSVITASLWLPRTLSNGPGHNKITAKHQSQEMTIKIMMHKQIIKDETSWPQRNTNSHTHQCP